MFGPHVAVGLAVYQHAHDHRHDALGEPVPIESGVPEGTREPGRRR